MSLNLSGYRISLDCFEPEANVNFVSHAHTDHTSGLGKGRKVLASSATIELIGVRESGKKIEPLEIPERARLLNAGHILGSRQLYLESEEIGASVIYSGDYQMQRSVAAEPIETKQADILIIDSTYPERETVFKDREETTKEIQDFISSKLESGIVLFGSYALGKAQELTKIANELGVAPVVDRKIHLINKVYERYGMPLGYSSFYKDEPEFEDAVGSNFVGITNVFSLQGLASRLRMAYGKRVYTAVATGFARSFASSTNAQFELSDHADYKQALEYIQQCSPRMVYTRGSALCSALLASNLRADGYDAMPLQGSNVRGTADRWLRMSKA